MPPITVIENEYATLYYIPENKLVRHKFHKPISGQPFRDLLNRGVELLAENDAHKWLSDDRENAAFPDDDNQWIVSEWIPKAIGAGWKYWALVVPDDVMARLNMGKYVSSLFELGLRMMVFSDPEEALNWINQFE